MAGEHRHRASPPDEVAALSSRHVQAAARVLAVALADDPGYRHLLPDDGRRVGELTATYRMSGPGAQDKGLTCSRVGSPGGSRNVPRRP